MTFLLPRMDRTLVAGFTPPTIAAVGGLDLPAGNEKGGLWNGKGFYEQGARGDHGQG